MLAALRPGAVVGDLAVHVATALQPADCIVEIGGVLDHRRSNLPSTVSFPPRQCPLFPPSVARETLLANEA